MKLLLKKGLTSKQIPIWVADSASTTGAGKTGIAFNAAGLTAYYYREGAASATAISLVSGTIGTWSSGGWVEVDAINTPGLYLIGLPDAALATGADDVVVIIKGATDMVPVTLEIQLIDADFNDAASFGLSRLDADVSSRADAADYTAIRAANLDNLDAAVSSRSTVTTAEVNAEVVDVLTVDTIPELSQAQPAATPTFRTAIMLLYQAFRNQWTQSGTEHKIRNDAGTVICKRTLTDDGTTLTGDKLASGP